jgi:hypothetical protein
LGWNFLAFFDSGFESLRSAADQAADQAAIAHLLAVCLHRSEATGLAAGALAASLCLLLGAPAPLQLQLLRVNTASLFLEGVLQRSWG